VPGFLGHNRLAHSGRINLRGSVGGRGTSTRASRALLLTPSLGASRAEGQLRRGGWDSWMSLPTSGLGVPQAASQSLHSGNSMGLDVCSAGGSTDSAVLLPRPEVRLPLAELLGGLGIRLVQRFQQARPLPQSRGYFRPHSGRRSGWDSLLGSIQLFRGDWRPPKGVPQLPWKRVGAQRGLRDPWEWGCNGLHRRERKCGMPLPKEWMRKGFP